MLQQNHKAIQLYNYYNMENRIELPLPSTVIPTPLLHRPWNSAI